MVSSCQLENAIARAADFIGTRRSADGLWRDFDTLAGLSSDWVTAFVSYALARSDYLRESILDACKVLLFRQRPNGGWSYNETVPTDCDSTAWTLMALSTVSTWRPSAVKNAIQYVKYHQVKTLGGFATYSVHDRIDRFIDAPDHSLTRGWLNAHSCVTGVVTQSLLFHREPVESESVQAAARYLLQERQDSNLWLSYWWKGYGYSTYHSLRALLMARVLSHQELRKTSRSLRSRQQQDGGWNDSCGQESEAFATAFIVLSLLLLPDEEALETAERGVAWLLTHQSPEGSWPTAPILRIPPPMVENPETMAEWQINNKGTGVIIEDRGKVFTSAAALWALSVFQSITD